MLRHKVNTDRVAPPEGSPGDGPRLAAFTLVELLMVMVIIAVLASLVVSGLNHATQHRARQIACLSVQHDLHRAQMIYLFGHDGRFVPIGLAPAAPPGSILRQPYTLWPDLVGGLVSREEIRCPVQEQFGIGMNHPEIGEWLRYGPPLSEIHKPVDTVLLADASQVRNLAEPDPDRWVARHPDHGTILFRTPSNEPWYSSPPFGERVVARHLERTNASFVDGHGELLPVSEIGFQFRRSHDRARWDPL